MSSAEAATPGRSGRWIIGALLLVAAIAIVLVTIRRGGDEADLDADPVVTVETATVEVRTLEVALDAIGTVRPRPGHVAEISAPEAARVERIMVAVGDAVSAGQPLVQLDASVWAARHHEAEAAVTMAQQAYERAGRLLAEGILARKDVETATAELARARADLAEARRLESLGTLRSPIGGIVVEVNASLARPVDPGMPVVEVVDPRGLEVIFHLSPSEAGRVSAGATVELAASGGGERRIVGQGTVRGISAAVDSASGSVAVRATVDAPARRLNAGEMLSGRITVERIENAMVVPLTALVPEGEGDGVQVFVVDEDGVAHATAVTVGRRTATDAQILSGLAGGETVVTDGAYGVTDGARIQRGPSR